MLVAPDAPSVTVIPTYSNNTKQLLRLSTTFREVVRVINCLILGQTVHPCMPLKESFNISDGVDGSAISYHINYTDPASGVLCASDTVLASTCENRACEHHFSVSELGSSCPPSSLNTIHVTVSAVNIIGNGLPSANVSVLGLFFKQLSYI